MINIMKNIISFIKSWIAGHTSLSLAIIFVIGIIAGSLIFGGTDSASGTNSGVAVGTDDHVPGSLWTCAMHPHLRLEEPGNCPICGMELIPVASEEESDDDEGDYTVKLSNTAMKIAEVSTSLVERKSPYKEVYLPGKVMPDERRISELTSRFPGRIEKLYVNFTGQKVRKGQILAKIYSPELVTAQRELFEAMKFQESNPGYYKAARNKLKLWDLNEKQIDDIVNSGDVQFYFDVLSPLTGTVTMRMVSLGDYVKEGTSLFEIIDLSHVWVMFDAYENDIPWIKLKDKIKFRIKSIPDVVFESTVTFIDPVINPKSRVAGVRAELDNPKDLLKPEMLASGSLKTMLPGSGEQLLVPKSAVLWSGKKAVVYVLTNDHQNMFRFTEITLGADAGNAYVVLDGLNDGELVATNGVFKIDAAAQLKGEKSMMNPTGGKQSMGGMAGMDMGGDSKKESEEVDKPKEEAGMSSMEMEMMVDPKFKTQIADVVKAYLNLKEAFVATDSKQAAAESKAVKAAMEKVDMGLLKGDNHMMWMDMMKPINNALDGIISAKDIEGQRLAFADLSDGIYNSIKMFHVSGLNVFYQFCPMARDGEGAYWLSLEKEIRNPYYGEAMLTCGETKETIK
jgi:membrane fusion protein, copper/silver efflux system